MEQQKQRDADRSRAAILDAAESLFAEHGFEVVTMAQVGAAAGVSRGTPGYFFGTKDALYRVVVERAADALRALADTLRARAGAMSETERLEETVTAFLALVNARPSLVKLIDREHGLVVGAPHAEALRDALERLGDDRDRAGLMALALCWFPISHPAAARLFGVDPAAPGFAAMWGPRVVAAVRGGGTGDPMPAAQAPVPAPAPPATTRTPDTEIAVTVDESSPDQTHATVVDATEPPKKKKKKKKKRG